MSKTRNESHNLSCQPLDMRGFQGGGAKRNIEGKETYLKWVQSNLKNTRGGLKITAASWCMLTGLLAALLATTGCKSKYFWDGPRIFAIGNVGPLNFKTNADLTIPIEGLQLANTLNHVVDVQLTGTEPISEQDYHYSVSSFGRDNLDAFNVIISSNYLSRVKTGDNLEMTVHIYETDPTQQALNLIVKASELTNSAPNKLELSDTLYQILYLMGQTNVANNIVSGETEKIEAELRKKVTEAIATEQKYATNNFTLKQYSNDIKIKNAESFSLNDSISADRLKISDCEQANVNYDKQMQSARTNLLAAIANLTNQINTFESLNKKYSETNKLSTNIGTNRYYQLIIDLPKELRSESYEMIQQASRTSARVLNDKNAFSNAIARVETIESALTNFAVQFTNFPLKEYQENRQRMLSNYTVVSLGDNLLSQHLRQSSANVSILYNKRSELKQKEQAFENLTNSINELESKVQKLTLQKDRESLESQITTGLLLLELKAFFRVRTAVNSQHKLQHKVSTASRKFTLYETEAFREEYNNKRVRSTDLVAFPLPELEAMKLFGEKIALSYFVVRFSVRNVDAKADRLISSGMIRATGRALVETTSGGTNHVVTRFTVPIEVAPHSAQQVYAVLTDESPKEARAVVFRSLEFAGAIASAYTLGFNAGAAAKDVVQLATGVGIPALNKFWTDRLPGYQRNIVNFAMDDLTKVPKGGVSSHKFLFFPKDKLEGIIIDQTAYGKEPWIVRNNPASGVLEAMGDPTRLTATIVHEPHVKQPNTFVAYLTFDNLDVPFENVVQEDSTSARQRPLNINADLTAEISFRQTIKDKWIPESNGEFLLAGVLQKADLSEKLGESNSIYHLTTNAIGVWKGSEKGWTNISKVQITQVLSNLTSLIRVLQPAIVSSSEFLAQIESLRLFQPEMLAIQTAVLGGTPSDRYAARLDQIENDVRVAKIFSQFYTTAARVLADSSVRDDVAHLDTLPSSDSPSACASALSALEDLKEKLYQLDTTRLGMTNRLPPSVTYYPITSTK